MDFLKGSWKTTSIGLTILIGAIVHFVFVYRSGVVAEMDVMTLVGGILGGLGFMVSRDNDKSSAELGIKEPGKKNFEPPIVMIGFAVMCLVALTGCKSPVEIAKSTDNARKAVAGTATKDVPFIADFISRTWADHETERADALFNAALAENSVAATLAPQIPAADGTAPKVVKVVPEAARAALQAKHDKDLAQIAVGKQQIYQAVVNRFTGNLAAAQALLDGQAAYYKTAGAKESTLQVGLDGALAAFEKFAPVLANVTGKK